MISQKLQGESLNLQKRKLHFVKVPLASLSHLRLLSQQNQHQHTLELQHKPCLA